MFNIYLKINGQRNPNNYITAVQRSPKPAAILTHDSPRCLFSHYAGYTVECHLCAIWEAETIVLEPYSLLVTCNEEY